jgi:hypothetical protein
MAKDHPFTIEIELHIEERVRRYRWCIYESGEPLERSTASYATTQKARADADKVMEKLITVWRNGKTANDNQTS